MTRPGSGTRDPGSEKRVPPRLADWLLTRVLPLGKRGESIRGDLLEEFRRTPEPGSRIPASVWYWQQTIRLLFHYLVNPAPVTRLSYPRYSSMWFEFSADFKAAFRGLRRAPGTSALIVTTLAIAIGAATIGFTFADLALLRGLPVDDPSRVVSVFASDTRGSNPRARVSGADFLDYKSQLQSLERMSAFREARAPLITNGQSQTLTLALATADLFVSMGQPPVLGRTFLPGEDAAGAAPVMVLAHRYWQAEMAGRAEVIGRTLQVGRELVTIVGVAPPQLEFGNLAAIDVWMPLHVPPDSPRDARDLRFIARLKAGASFEQAAAEMAALGDRLATEHPLSNGGWTMRLVPVRELTGGDGFWVSIALFLLSIGLLLAIATANISNLIMVRATARMKELAVRTALGARGGRLLRQFVTEGFVLAALGAALSLPVAYGGLQLINAVSADGIFQQLRIDWHELSFVALLALICPVLFTLAPARLIARPDMRQVLASQSRGATASMKGRRRLVVAQVALAVILLTASSLALKSIRTAFGVPLGMTIEQLLVFGIDFNDVAYPSAEQANAAARAMRDALAELPGVRAASMVDALPILGDRAAVALAIDNVAPAPGEATRSVVVTGATDDVGQVLGLRVLAGAWWTTGDTSSAVITQATADRYFGGAAEALGRPIALGTGAARADYRVVGVTNDVANTNRTEAAPPRVWVPLDNTRRRVTYILEAGDPATLGPGVRSLVAATAPTLPIDFLDTFQESMRRAESSDYVVIGLLAAFSGVALVLAITGLFGVVSYSVAQRIPEFGTRIALGASAGSVMRQVAGQSLGLLAVGSTVGLAGGIGVGFLMRGILFGVSPADPATLASVTALLTVVTLAATALPAWRASRIDPVVALRAE